MLVHTDPSMLAAAIQQSVPGMTADACLAFAARLIQETDPRLEENVTQWIAGQPLTDIWVGKYCLGMVMEIRGSQNFLEALEAMNCYIADAAVGERKIWRVRR